MLKLQNFILLVYKQVNNWLFALKKIFFIDLLFGLSFVFKYSNILNWVNFLDMFFDQSKIELSTFRHKYSKQTKP